MSANRVFLAFVNLTAAPPHATGAERRTASGQFRLISFDELYKYYRNPDVKSRITELEYDPWNGLRIAMTLLGLMALIALGMLLCRVRDTSDRRRSVNNHGGPHTELHQLQKCRVVYEGHLDAEGSCLPKKHDSFDDPLSFDDEALSKYLTVQNCSGSPSLGRRSSAEQDELQLDLSAASIEVQPSSVLQIPVLRSSTPSPTDSQKRDKKEVHFDSSAIEEVHIDYAPSYV